MQLLSGFVGTAGGVAGLVLPLSRMSCNGMPSLIEKEYPSLTVRACDGLSWDTPVGILTFESRARGYGQMGIC